MPIFLQFFLESYEKFLTLSIMLYAIAGLVFLGLIFLPQFWVRNAISRHAKPRDDFPGTGGELARHLLDEAGLQSVVVEVTKNGDHYDPIAKVVRLTPANHDGKSVSAVAIAAHEVGHALQDGDGYKPLLIRTRYAGTVQKIEKLGGVIMLATPVIAAITRAPSIIAFEIGAGLLVLLSSVAFHLVTLPVEMDASFGRALPILKSGKYLMPDDMPAANEVLKAAAFTYVSAALVSLLDIARWIRILR